MTEINREFFENALKNKTPLVTRDGRKVILDKVSDSGSFRVFGTFEDDGHRTFWHITGSFTGERPCDDDIVGVWEENGEIHFDLTKALAGQPVKLRNGNKAFIVGVIPAEYKCDFQLIGYYVAADNYVYTGNWDKNGNYYQAFAKRKFDIVGMWEEPTRIINGIEVPPCVTEETWEDCAFYYHVALSSDKLCAGDGFTKSCEYDHNLIKRGLVFETEEGAVAMAKAILNYDRQIAEKISER